MPSKQRASKRIRSIEYDRIDRVEAGAQPGAHIPLVKRRVKIEKLVDPASLDAQVQRIRDEFREKYSDNYGCCAPCSGWVYCDAVYGEPDVVVAVDSKGNYWQFSYTVSGDNEIEFGEPEAVTPNVKWAAITTDDDAPTPVMKALWSVSPAERFQRLQKEQAMPAPKKPVTKALDLTALDDETRAAVEAAFTENASLTADRDAFLALAEAEPEPTVVDTDDDDLTTTEGLQAAIAKSKSPEIKRLLKATLKRVSKAEEENAELRTTTVQLQKAERVRVFKARAQVLPNVAAHAIDEDADSDDDAVTSLAKMLDTIDEKAGPDVCDAVETMLTKAQGQIRELLGKKGVLKSVGRNSGDAEGLGASLSTGEESPEDELDRLVKAEKAAHPDESESVIKTRVVKANRHLYNAAQAG